MHIPWGEREGCFVRRAAGAAVLLLKHFSGPGPGRGKKGMAPSGLGTFVAQVSRGTFPGLEEKILNCTIRK